MSQLIGTVSWAAERPQVATATAGAWPQASAAGHCRAAQASGLTARAGLQDTALESWEAWEGEDPDE